MQRYRVIFPDTTVRVSALCKAAVPAATVGAKRPGTLGVGVTYIQYRNDSGPEDGMLKVERYGINVWAPTLRAALDAGRAVQAEFRSNAADGVIVRATGGAGPYEVVGDGDDVDSHAHAYCTVELTVKASNY